MQNIFVANKTQNILNHLKEKSINTWFDIGYFLDKLKSAKPLQPVKTVPSLNKIYSKYRRGIGFITFELGFDGVTVEMMKYANALSNILGKDTSIHWLTGDINPSLEYFKDSDKKIFIDPLFRGFEKSGLVYKSLFHTKLKRGDELYNSLPSQIWNDTILLVQKLLEYIEDNHLELITTVNTVSNPGNLSLVMALAIINKLHGISIVSINHDFYWEGGSIRKKGSKRGPRDHFFKNADIGEIFSLIQTLYPWDSPSWVHANINTLQSNTILKKLGFNPFNITEITSSIDTSLFKPRLLKEKMLVYKKLNLLFCQNNLNVSSKNNDLFSILNSSNNPVVISNSHHSLKFNKNTLLFLQPTRIISRKRIEKDFSIIESVFNGLKNKKRNKTIVLLITGPIANGSDKYVQKLLVHIQALFRRLSKYDHRVFIAFKLGKDTNESFLTKGLTPLEMNDIYSVSSFIMLPSEQEGRGLPILESAAAGVPLIASRFEPEEVYEEVIGSHLSRKKKLKVIEIPKKQTELGFVQQILDLIEDKQKRKKITSHNRRVVQSRYSMKNLELDFERILERLYLIQLDRKRHKELAESALDYMHQGNRSNPNIVFDCNRTYIQGIMKYRFLSQAKSIVDPSYFRIEEKEVFSEIYEYAKSKMISGISEDQKELFFNSIRELFFVTGGKYKIEFDATFDYRYRDNTIYLWRELTQPKLFGTISYIENKLFNNVNNNRILQEFLPKINSLLSDNELIKQTNYHKAQVFALDIDITDNNDEAALKNKIINEVQIPMQIHDWKIFAKRILEKPQKLVIFPGKYSEIAWDLLMYDNIIDVWNKKTEPYSLVFVCRKKRYNGDITLENLHKILKSGSYPNLCKAYQNKLIKLIPIGSKSSSVDLLDISPKLKNALSLTKKTGGHVLSKGEHNYFALDLLDIPSFRYGTIRSTRSQAVFDMPAGSQFFQFVPAGFRTFFSFPLTLETPLQFSKSLNSIYDFDNPTLIEKKLTEYKIYLDKHGMSLQNAISVLENKNNDSQVETKRLSGKYKDGYSWTGVAAKLKLSNNKFSYHILSSKKNKSLPQFIQTLKYKIKKPVVMGWNGGYILNYELVGKLNLPEDCIGTPLGFVMKNNKIISLPLYNRPVFAVKKNGSVLIDKLKLDFSGRIIWKQNTLLDWDSSCINPKSPPLNKVAVYTPLSGLEKIPIKERILIVIGGRKVLKIIYDDGLSDEVDLFSAGCTFSLPLYMENQLNGLKENDEINFDLDLPPKWSKITDAIGAGPQLISDGKVVLKIKEEGWLLDHSIKTQAARRDRENDRGPKIGCGLTKSGDIICVVIESRIRESVGATYIELAQILKDEGSEVAMGFDPGGSATLWVDGVINIVPYTNSFSKNQLTGKPQPRSLANAILISMKK